MNFYSLKNQQQISILEWFLNDHMTLKTGAMKLKIQLCHDRNKLHLKYIKFEKSYIKL